MAEYVELYIDQGADFSTTISINDEQTNIPGNLTNIVVTGQIRKSLLSVNASAQFECTVTNAANGEILIEMTSANTSNLKAGSYFYDVRLSGVGNTHSRLIEGVLFVTPGITR